MAPRTQRTAGTAPRTQRTVGTAPGAQRMTGTAPRAQRTAGTAPRAQSPADSGPQFLSQDSRTHVWTGQSVVHCGHRGGPRGLLLAQAVQGGWSHDLSIRQLGQSAISHAGVVASRASMRLLSDRGSRCHMEPRLAGAPVQPKEESPHDGQRWAGAVDTPWVKPPWRARAGRCCRVTSGFPQAAAGRRTTPRNEDFTGRRPPRLRSLPRFWVAEAQKRPPVLCPGGHRRLHRREQTLWTSLRTSAVLSPFSGMTTCWEHCPAVLHDHLP